MAQVFSSMGEAADRRINQMADASRDQFNRFKSKSLEEVFADTSAFLKSNAGRILIGALATALLVSVFMRKEKTTLVE
ncbi:MAG TPA: hypothetical protein VFW45_15595 [Candidatus Polarisedimenticolia bacterium]|nr:hypothetical protein [Candidatus Polarisedimenticolia bacterium]